MNMYQKLLSYSLLLPVVFLMPAISQAEIYKWIDENGKVHFSDRKLDGVGQETLELDTPTTDWNGFEIAVRTANVELTAKETKNIVDGVNYVYEFYDRVLYFDYHKTVPVSILVLEDRRAYVKYLTDIGRVNSIPSYGVYFSKENQIVVYIREDREATFRTIRHEVSHAIVHTTMPYAPAWLDEGLAEQMETINRSDRGLYIEPHLINQRDVAWARSKGKLTDIPEFLKLPSNTWRHSLRDDKQHLQSQSGQFVYFLLSTPPNRNFVTSLMHKFNQGDRTISYHLVEDNYIGGVKTLDVSWSNWVKDQHGGVINLF